MRWLRACLLLGLLIASTSVVIAAALDALVEGWRVAEVAAGSPAEAQRSAGADLAALLTGGCALLVGLAWLWFVAAVTACTGEALRAGRSSASVVPPTLLRPATIRAVVATCLGVTVLAAPASAQSPAVRARATHDDVRAAADTAATTAPRLLDGLPVPDRATGDLRGRAAGSAPPRLRVVPGDSLWTLTAGLLPAGTPADTVASGWRLLYAANRDVIGADPDLLQPGQTLRITPALQALVHQPTPLDSDAGGPP